ncbi:MAG: MBL fold metallo-hydrolase [Patescibacteria group bacterium]
MEITKFGHCCLLVRENGLSVLIDPGTFTTRQNDQKDIDVILITHEHPDHLDIQSLKRIRENNPQAKIITNESVGLLLQKESIPFDILGPGQKTLQKGVLIEGYGERHALMHSSIQAIKNTGYMIAERFFYPGDAFTSMAVPVEILALPVAGPWMRLLEAIDYALEIKPSACFPVHEGILKTPGSTHIYPPQVLEPKGIKFSILEIDKTYTFLDS